MENENLTVTISGRLLEVVSDVYEGTPYGKIKLRSSEVAGNKILSYKVNVKKMEMQKLFDSLDDDVTVTCSIDKGANDSAVLKVVAVS